MISYLLNIILLITSSICYESDLNQSSSDVDQSQVRNISFDYLLDHRHDLSHQKFSFICRFNKIEHIEPELPDQFNKTFSVLDPQIDVLDFVQAKSNRVYFVVDPKRHQVNQVDFFSKFDLLKCKASYVKRDENKLWLELIEINKIDEKYKQSQPNIIRAHLAYDLYSLEKHHAAAVEFKKAYTDEFDFLTKGRISKYLARSLYEIKKYKQASVFFEKSWDINRDVQTGTWYAQTLIKLKEYKQAIKFLDKLIDMYPSHVESRLALANSYLNIKDEREAIAQCQAVLAIDPHMEHAYLILGQSFLSLNDEDKAISIFREALKKELKNKGQFHLELAHIYKRRGQYQFAIIEYDLAKRYYPVSAQIYLNVADCLIERGKKYYQSAIANYEKAMQLDPNLDYLNQKICEIYFENHDYYKVLEILEPHFSDGDLDMPAQVMLAISYENTNKPQEAIKLFKRVSQSNPSGYAYVHLGYLYDAQDQHIKALQKYEKALDFKMEKQFMFFCALRLSDIYMLLNNDKKALKYGRMAHQIDEENVDGLLCLGQSLELTHAYEEAFDIFDQCLNNFKLNEDKQTLVIEHWVYNSLMLGKTSQDQISKSRKYLSDSLNPKAQLAYGWSLARHGDMKASKILDDLTHIYPEAKLAKIELLFHARDYSKIENLVKSNLKFDEPYLQRQLEQIVNEVNSARNEGVKEKE